MAKLPKVALIDLYGNFCQSFIIRTRRMKKKTLKKRAFGLAAAVLAGGMFLCGCVGGKDDNGKKQYDPSTRVATDSGEQVFSIDDNYDRYNNYIELYDGDGDIYDIGDPFVFRFDGKYYLYTSLNGNKKYSGKIPCWESDNMVDWTWSGWAYDPGSSLESSETYIAFAPEVVYYKGWFYMCESRRGQGHFFFKSDKPNGPFTLISDNLGRGIDGSFYLHDDGSLYFLSAYETYNGLSYCTIDFVENGGETQVVLGKAQKVENAYLNGWTEGPGYFKRNGFSYLTYTGNHVDSAGYKVAYSYTTGALPFENLSAKWYNTTLISTGLDNESLLGYGANNNVKQVTNYRGLGHSSNVIGPDLDGIYTAYHNANRINYDSTMVSSTRKYNLTRYFTNGSYVLTDGLGNYSKIKPAAADYAAAGSDLNENGKFALSTEKTENLFTAEVSFRLAGGKGSAIFGFADSNNYSSVAIDGTDLSFARVVNGKTEKIASAKVSVSTNSQAIHTVKVIGGSHKTQVYYDNMLLVTSDKTVNAGSIGVSDGAVATSVQFKNDAFGTSDFEAVKDLTGSFAATAYLKGENRGFRIADAKVIRDGVRQGEKESTVYSSENEAYALILKPEDWVKYLVDSPADDDYSLSLTVGKQSKGCVFEIIVDNEKIIKAEIPENLEFGDASYANVNVGSFAAEKGVHTLKIRVFDGTLDVLNFSTSKNATALDQVSDLLRDKNSSVFTQKVGTKASFSGAGLMTNSADERTLLLTGNRGVSNYEFSVNVKIVSQEALGGILFRMNDFSYTNYKTTQLGTGFDGYYLSIGKYLVNLYKYSHGKESLKLGGLRPPSGQSFNGGAQVRVTVRCENSKITIYLNGEEFLSCVDAEGYTCGYISFYSEKGSSYLFSDYEYFEL